MTDSVALASDDDVSIAEVVVTAQRRTERALDVPISMAAFSGEELQSRGLVSTSDLLTTAPNVNLTSGTGSTQDASVSVRGIGTLAFTDADQAIGVYMDDVFIGSTGGIDFDLSDLERIEILRGPQGSLYGRSALGGAINVVPNAPQPENDLGVAMAIGEHDTRRARVVGNVALSDRVFVRASAGWRKYDGWIHNDFDGVDALTGETLPVTNPLPDGNETLAGRLALRALLNDFWTLTVSGDHLEDEGQTVPYADVEVLKRRHAANIAVPQMSERQISSATAKLEYGGDSVRFQSISAYREVNRETRGGQFQPTAFYAKGMERRQDQLSQELRLLGSQDGGLEWIAGLFYFESSEFSRSFFGFPQGYAPLPAGYTEASVATIDTKSYAAYLEGTYPLADRLKATLGLRYGYDDKSIDYSHDNSIGLPFTIFSTRALGHQQSTSFDDVLPKLTLTYALHSDANVYLSTAKGYKAGGFQVQFAGAPSATMPPDLEYAQETGWNYEVGLKTSLWDRRASLSLSAYYFDWTDQQVSIYEFDDSGVSGFVRIANAPKSRSMGAELELAAQPTAHLSLRAGVGYVDSEFRDYPNPSAGIASANGNSQPNVPSLTADVGGEYEIPLSFGEIKLGLDASHRGSQFADVLNSYEMDSYTLLNARIGLHASDNRWSVYLMGKNLNDEHYITFAYQDFSVFGERQVSGVPGMGREYSLEVQWRLRGDE
jgi:iron complex outermembrane receptor protein